MNKNEIKGLHCDVLRAKYDGVDCTNGGISSKHDTFVLVGLGQEAQVFEPSKDAPALKLVKRIISGEVYLHAEPVNSPKGVGWTFGGNFLHTSDGRFPNRYPIAIHDRQETPEEYEVMSR